MKKPVNMTPAQLAEEADINNLMKALIATPEAKALLAKKQPKSIDDLTGGKGLITQLFKPLMQELLDAEMTEHLGYPKHDSAGYLSGNSRNGSYSRTLRGSEGKIQLDIPRDRNGEYSPRVITSYKQVSTDLEQKIIALYAFGTSTKDITEFLYDTYDINISEGFISQVTNAVLTLARDWQQRPLQAIYPIAYLDAIHVKCREGGRVINKAVHVIMAYDITGRKDILGHYISSGSEGAKFWLSAITDLKNRGVKDIFIASVDGLAGFEQAIASVFPDTTVQRCIVHAIRSSLNYIPHKLKREFVKDLKLVYQASTKAKAEANLEILKNKWQDKYAMAVKVWTDNWDALSHYFTFSDEIRKMIYTTNPIESYNSVVRKYIKNKRSFVSDEALQKMLYLATQKASERWNKCTADWPTILNQFAIHFDGRLDMN